nr:hypothetical protein [Tanacetum cinerariifolium]
MLSENAQSAVTYTSISSDSDGPSWGIPLMNAGELLEMDSYKEVAQQGQAHPLSPAYVPDLIELDEHVPVYVSKLEHPEYHPPSDDDILEDPSEEHEPEDGDEDPEKDPNEEHEPEDEDTKEPSKGFDETEPFEEDEIAALIDAFASGSSPFLLPPTSPAYDQAQLGRRAAMIRRRDDILEEDMPPWRRFVPTAPPPGCDVAESSAAVAARAPRENVGYVRALQASERRMMTSIEEVNLRVSYLAQGRRQESVIFYTQLLDARTDRRAIRLEINVVRGQRTAYETKLQELHQAYLSYEAQNRALLARLETLETHMSHMEWQRQSAEDLAITQMMRIHTLEARARTDMVEDIGSSWSKGNDVAAYTQRFQELAMMCTKILADETKKVDKRITFNPHLTFTFNSQQEMDQQYPTIAKIPVLDTRKFKQWQFWIQQHLQYEHYALWEVIKFRYSYTVPANSPSTTTTDTTSGEASTKSGRTVTLTAEDMQKKKNDVKARTTLLLYLPDEHQMRFSKYKTTRELWAKILKTFGGNMATKKTKKNLLKQQYGNFEAEGSETLEKTFTRLQVIVGQLQFMNVYESEVQKKSEPNSQNMAFISSAKHSSRNEDGNTAFVPTASTNVPTASASDINQIYEDDMEEIDIKWNMALLSMRADKFWKKTGKKISIQGSDVAGFDKSKFECFNFHKMGHFARECRASKNQDRGRRDNYRQGTLEFYNESNNECIEILKKKLETLKEEKEGVDEKLACLLKASKDLDNLIESQRNFPTANRKFPTASRKFPTGSTKSSIADMGMKGKAGNSQNNIDDKGYWDSSCSRHMTGNISYISDYEPFDRGYVSFGQGGCKIT